MANSSYMPGKQAEQVAWAATFVSVVGPEAPAYGVPESLMTEFGTANTTLQAAWLAASEPSSRTRGTVAAKDAALKAMKKVANNVISVIQGTATVTDQMKRDAGITVRKTRPSPTPPPDSAPYIKVKKINGRTVTAELCQDQIKRGKPAKVTGATIFMAISETAPQTPADWTFYSSTGKTTVTIPFGPSDVGTTVWITAFWTNAKNQSGPGATAVSVNLPAGGTLPGQEASESPLTEAA